MEKTFYTAKDIQELTGFARSKAYDIIKTLNIEIKEKYKDSQNPPLLFAGRINKEYFDKRMKIGE